MNSKPILRLLSKLYRRIPPRIRRPIWNAVSRNAPSLLSAHHQAVSPSSNNPSFAQSYSPIDVRESGSHGVDQSIALLTRAVWRLAAEQPAPTLVPLAPQSAMTVTSGNLTEPHLGLFWDVRAIQSAAHAERGIARYVAEQAREFFTLNESGGVGFVFNDSVPVRGALAELHRELPLVALSEAAKRVDAKIWYLTSPVELELSLQELLPNSFRRHTQIVATCYDLIPLRMSDVYLRDTKTRRLYFERIELYRHADLILCISQATAEDVHQLLDIPRHRLRVINAGVSRFFSPDVDPGASAVLKTEVADLQPGFILLPGGIDPRKNLERSIEAYSNLPQRLRSEYQLVITCRATEMDKAHLLSVAEKFKVKNRVLVTGFVSDEALRALYQSARIVLFPSLYEGFGLPVVEALACGTEVVVGNNSSLREIVHDESLRFDAEECSDIARVLTARLDGSPLPKAELLQMVEQFRWEAVAELTSSALTELAGETKSRPSRLEVAILSPLPPVRSGVADYVQKLSPHLAQRASLSFFSPGGTTPVTEFSATENSLGSFEYVIAHVGNSIYHLDILEMLRLNPGRFTVELHDVRLLGLYGELGRRIGEIPESFLHQHTRSLYGHRFADAVGTVRLSAPPDAERAGVWMTKEVLELARNVIVHSHEARLVIERERPGTSVTVIPLAIEPRLAMQNRIPGLIVSTGFIAASKNPQLLVDAVALLRQTVPNVKLVFVGEGRLDDFVTSSQNVALLRKQGVLVESGYVDERQYWEYLQTAKVVVQLRASTNGETSASISDAIAAGCEIIGDSRSLYGAPEGATRRLVSETVSGLAQLLAEVLAGQSAERPWIADPQNALSVSPATIANATLIAVKSRVTSAALSDGGNPAPVAREP
jgi:glycosyltransferase involved in cell wall biosynthesis